MLLSCIIPISNISYIFDDLRPMDSMCGKIQVYINHMKTVNIQNRFPKFTRKFKINTKYVKIKAEIVQVNHTSLTNA